MPSASLTDLPVDVLLDNLLPSIPVNDLLNLSSTNRFFSVLGSDDTFWKRKLEEDFNFTDPSTARTSGWKVIYKGLSHPRIYTWGENNHGRLGLTKVPEATLGHRDVPFPVRLRIPGVRIVSLIAGGMSFHALDSEGNVYVWGTMDGTQFALNSDGFSDPGKCANTPLKLALPVPMRTMSSGRLHSSGLDTTSSVWTFMNWGRPFKLSSPRLDHTSPDTTAIQVECGWMYSSVLTESGDILVWFPFDRAIAEAIAAKNEELDALPGGSKAMADLENKVIPCIAWELQKDPARLPPIPNELPKLITMEEDLEPNKVVKIAGFDQHLVALTQHGHILKFNGLSSEASIARGTWIYLPNFSEVAKIREHPVFVSADDIPVPDDFKITHITAHYETFVAYSTGASSIILMGDQDTTTLSRPKVLPSLQNKSVIQILLGDYHSGALTSTGKLFTWGQYSHGALGLGDPKDIEPGDPGGFATPQLKQVAINRRRGQVPNVQEPTEVRFDHTSKEGKRRERFCFGAAAAGWHMGALVIDLETTGDADDDEDGSDKEDNLSESRMPGHFDDTLSDQVPLPGWHSGLGGRGGFRIGYAGRGLMRGGPHRGQGH